MVNDQTVHIIMPVKDAIDKAEQAIRAVVASGYTLCVYDDNSEPENALRLDALGAELGIEVVHLSELTSHPSPNYRTVLIDAQRRAIAEKASLVIIESDVVVRPDTIDRLIEGLKTPAERPVGMVAAVTTDEQGNVNFPYEYARRRKADGECKKRLSFCCTLLTKELLRAYDFEQLNPEKNWYDVFISHLSVQLGFTNILQVSNPVLHTPHSSRPWKLLKYTNPILYYWRKLTLRRDKI